jgi:hypothetical protein
MEDYSLSVRTCLDRMPKIGVASWGRWSTMRLREIYRDQTAPRYYTEVSIESSRRYKGRFQLYIATAKGYILARLTRKQVIAVGEQFQRAIREADAEGMPRVPATRIQQPAGSSEAPRPEASGMDRGTRPTHTITLKKKDGTAQEITYRDDGWAVPGDGHLEA